MKKPLLVEKAQEYADNVESQDDGLFTDLQIEEAFRAGFFVAKNALCNMLKRASQGAPADSTLKALTEQVKQYGITTWEI